MQVAPSDTTRKAAQACGSDSLVEDDADIATICRFKPESGGFSVQLGNAGEAPRMLAFQRRRTSLFWPSDSPTWMDSRSWRPCAPTSGLSPCRS